MKKNCYFYVLGFWAGLGLTACHKPSSVEGGTVNVLVNVKHHQAAIAFSKVYIKYNTLIYPGKDSTLYDTYKVADENGFLRFDDLGNGKKEFLLFAAGIDPDWDTTKLTRVWGYYPVAISTSLGEDKEVKVIIPVSE
jgi:hypothetical protein